MTNCIWYVSGFHRPWEAAVIGNLAAAMKARIPALQVYVDGGTANLRADGVLSWNSLTFFERVSTVLFKGKLWHLWGKAPFWWGLIRLRARTVHTSLDDVSEWMGHPTRLFAEQVSQGESVIKPTFEVKVAWAGDDGGADDSSAAVLLAAAPDEPLREALAEMLMTGISLEASESDSSLKKGRALFVDGSPSSALLAAYMTMQGFPVAAYETPLLQNLLGRGGYLVPRSAEKTAWMEVLDGAMSEAGRSAAASARRFLKENYATSDSADSLEDLYRAVGKKGKP